MAPGRDLPDGITEAQRLQAAAHQERILNTALSSLAEKYPDVEMHKHVSDGSPVETLVHWSRTADVVVVGARGRASTIGLVGSVSRAVAEHAYSTVVVVRN